MLNNASKPADILNKIQKGHCQRSTLTQDNCQALKQKQKSKERLLPFVTTYDPAVQDLKEKLMPNQQNNNTKSASAENNFFKDLRSYSTRGKSLKDMLVRAKNVTCEGS